MSLPLSASEGKVDEAVFQHSRIVLISVALALLSFLAFANTFGNHFALDDQTLIVENTFVRKLELANFFTTGYWAGAKAVTGDDPPPGKGGAYRPLALLTYALNYQLGGLNPFGYHVFNLVLYASVVILLYLLVCQVGCSWIGAFTAVSLFAVHPLHTEAVTAIHGRSELLMAFGVLASLNCYIAWRREGKNTGAGVELVLSPWGVASLAAFAVGLLSKEQAATLPGLLVFYDLSVSRLRRMDTLRTALPRYLPYVILLALYFAGRALALGSVLPPETAIPFLNNPLAHVSWDTRLLTAIRIAGEYLWLCVWPARLVVDYSYNSIPMISSPFELPVLGSVAAWGSLLSVAVWSYFRGSAKAFFGVALTVLTFLPTANLFFSIGTIMGERLFFLPSAGLCLMLAFLWDGARRRVSGASFARLVRFAGLGAFAVALVLFTVRTVVRNQDWENDRTLFESAAHLVPTNAKVWYSLGALESDPAEALRDFDRGVLIYPQYLRTHWEVAVSYGVALLKSERVEDAIRMLNRAAVLKPKFADTYYYLGLGYMKKGSWEAAETAYRKAVELENADSSDHLNFGPSKRGLYEEAILATGEAIRTSGDFSRAVVDRARALERLGRLNAAASAYSRVLQVGTNLTVAGRLEELYRRLGE